jgi:Fe-S cluster assembly ATP-binding protein
MIFTSDYIEGQEMFKRCPGNYKKLLLIAIAKAVRKSTLIKKDTIPGNSVGFFMTVPLLVVRDLFVSVGETVVLQHINLTIESGSVRWLLGPNGSGKSSLAYTIMGHPRYIVTAGTIQFAGTDITMMRADERARLGLFLAIQQPVDLPGITMYTLLKEAYRARLGASFSMGEFDVHLANAARTLAIELPLLQRPLQGFSGGQKKKFELLQLLVLCPRFVMLDELEAGLDVDALALAGRVLAALRKQQPSSSFLVISHQQRLADYLPADGVHIIKKGFIEQSGGAALIAAVAKEGFDAVGG